MTKKYILVLTILLIIFGLGILLYFQISSPKVQQTIGTSESENSNHTIEVLYTDYGGSFAEKGGVHLNVFLKSNRIFTQKKDITNLVNDSIPCSSEMGACTKRISNEEEPLYCEGNVWDLQDGTRGCVTKKLEQFTIEGDTLIWYGKRFEL